MDKAQKHRVLRRARVRADKHRGRSMDANGVLYLIQPVRARLAQL